MHSSCGMLALLLMAALLLSAVVAGIAPQWDIERSANNVLRTRPNCPDNMMAYEIRDGTIRCYWVASEQLRAESGPMNVITVKPNCPEGQQWISGQCVDVWPKNVVTVPPNCPPGQVWIGGQCRDVWRMKSSTYCPNGMMINDECITGDDIFAKIAKPIQDDIVMDAELFDGTGSEYAENRRVVNVPNHCPVGFRPDANGVCRPIF